MPPSDSHGPSFQFITTTGPPGIRSPHQARLAHIHAMKECSRKQRLSSQLRLQNFRVFTADHIKRRYEAEKHHCAPSSEGVDPLSMPSKTVCTTCGAWPPPREQEVATQHKPTPRVSGIILGGLDPFACIPIAPAALKSLLNSCKYRYLMLHSAAQFLSSCMGGGV